MRKKFQIDFRQKSFFLYSPGIPRYHAFISIRCLTLRIPPSSILFIQRSSFYTLDHLWLFRGSALLSDLSRYLKTRNKRYGTEASNSRLFSRSTERTIRLLCPRPPFFSWLHFCPLLDILFYWTKPSFLPSCLPSVPTCNLSLCRRLYTRGYVPSCGNLSTLSSSISLFSSLLPVPSGRNACPSFLTTCLSSATSFYSASRISNVIIHPSAKLLRES